MGLQVHAAGLAFMCLGVLMWVIALGGLGASTANCNSISGAEVCAKKYQLEWWALWFEFFLLVLMIATCATKQWDKIRHMWGNYLSMCTVLLMISARNFITDSFFTKEVLSIKKVDYKKDAYNAAAAGFVLLCIINFILVIFVTIDFKEDGNKKYTNQSAELSSSQFQASSV